MYQVQRSRKKGAPKREEKKKMKWEKKSVVVAVFHSSAAYLYLYIHFSQTLKTNTQVHFHQEQKKRNKERDLRRCQVFDFSAAFAHMKMKTWWSRMTFGHRHIKLAQLCEDKGKACAGLQPSTSIWVLSSLGPGGTWEYTSQAGVRKGYTAPCWTKMCNAAGGLFHIYEVGFFNWITV